MQNIKKYFLFFILFPVLISSGDVGPKVKRIKLGNLHIISIGINKYKGSVFNNAVNDAKTLVEKIKSDNKKLKENLGKLLEKINSKPSNIKDLRKDFNEERKKLVVEVYSHEFFDENATLKNIREAFKIIIKEAKPEDSFVFFFAGMNISVNDLESALILYQEIEIDYKQPESNKLIKTSELASLMNQISSQNQLVIFDSSYGKDFSNNLMSYLFEDNPFLASVSNRNRIIITPKDLSYDSFGDNISHAPLVFYILKSGNIINAFKKTNYYNYNLQKIQLEFPVGDGDYFIIRKESDYRDLIIRNYKKSNSRGTLTESNEKKEKKDEEISKVYAFMVGTDKYNENQNSWADLKNPINDAEVIANILETKFGAEVLKVYDKTKNEILREFVNFKSKIDQNDKLIFFVAGHGYYSQDFSDGFLVLNDSKKLNEDIIFESYLPMARLTRLLDGVNCKQVFTIFDVCFGATFDSNAKDVKLSNYSKMNSDISIDEFIKRKEKYTSRIFLASGKAEVPDYWNNSLNHSPFASKLIDFLRNEKDFISPSKIYEALEANITEPVLKSHGSHEERGDFILKVK